MRAKRHNEHRSCQSSFWLLAGFYFLPLLLHRYFGASSFAAGLIIAATLILAFALIIRGKIRINTATAAVLILFLTYLLAVSIYPIISYPSHDINKSLATIFTLPILVLAAIDLLKSLDTISLNRLSLTILASQLLSIPLHYLGVFTNLAYEKSSLLFNEPSHFAITITPLSIIFIATTYRPTARIIYLLGLITISLYYQNLTLLVCIALCATIILGMLRNKLAKTGIAIVFLAAAFAISQLQAEYILSRIDINSQDNASTLTLLSAYERIYLTFSEETIWGVGIQGFGSNSPTGSFFSILYAIDGRVNLNDGGVTIAKLASETGVFFIPIALLIALSSTKTFLSRNLSRNEKLLYYGFFFGGCIELFLRGVGYYSINLILLAALVIKTIFSHNSRAIKHGNKESKPPQTSSNETRPCTSR